MFLYSIFFPEKIRCVYYSKSLILKGSICCFMGYIQALSIYNNFTLGGSWVVSNEQEGKIGDIGGNYFIIIAIYPCNSIAYDIYYPG